MKAQKLAALTIKAPDGSPKRTANPATASTAVDSSPRTISGGIATSSASASSPELPRAIAERIKRGATDRMMAM